MASPASDAFRAELEADITDLDPRIRGLEDLVHDTMSEELRADLSAELARLRERRSHEAQTLAAMDALDANGYPALPPMELPQHLFNELQREIADAQSAAARFESAPLASNIAVGLGSPADK